MCRVRKYFPAILTAVFALNIFSSAFAAIEDKDILLLEPPDLDYKRICIKKETLKPPSRDWTKFKGKIPRMPAKELLRLGRIYEEGIITHNIFPDPALAVRFYRAAMESNSKLRHKAKLRLAQMYIRGNGVPQDIEYAKFLLNSTINFIQGAAASSLATIYIIEGNYSKALHYLRLSAFDNTVSSALRIVGIFSQNKAPTPSSDTVNNMFVFAQNILLEQLSAGNCEVIHMIGQTYADRMVPSNEEYAIKWFKISASLGYAQSMNRLAGIYMSGKQENIDKNKAVDLWEKAAKMGSLDAMYHLGSYYVFESDKPKINEGIALLEKSANLGHNDSIERLIKFYRQGVDGNTNPEKEFFWLKRAAEQKDPSSDILYEYGKRYYDGVGTKRDYKQAVSLLRKAAIKGHGDAANLLGKAYQKGLGVEPSQKKALKFFRLGASKGNKSSILSMSRNYSCGISSVKHEDLARKWLDRAINQRSIEALIDASEAEALKLSKEGYKESASLLRRAAKIGSRKAMIRLSVIYNNGTGVQKDPAKSALWRKRALASGDERAEGLIELAKSYEKGLIPDDKATEKAIALLEEANNLGSAKAAEELGKLLLRKGGRSHEIVKKAVKMLEIASNKGEQNAMIALADFHTNEQNLPYGIDYKEGTKWLLRAAEEGQIQAMLFLAYHYHFGTGTLNKEPEKANFWMRKALTAYPCNASERVDVARYYDLGIAVEKDNAKSAYWANKALEADIEGTGDMMRIAAMYENGYGLEVDPYKSRQWYEKAAIAGDAKAMQTIGRIYMKGDLKGQDIEKAHEWFERSIAKGNIYALEDLGRIYAYGRGVERDEEKAVHYLQRAADKGALKSMMELGIILANNSSKYYDKGRAEELLQKAADAGLKPAKFALLEFYNLHPDLSAKSGKANKILTEMVDDPDKSTKDMLLLSRIYIDGLATEIDLKKSLFWLRSAANAGDGEAMRELGRAYIGGTYGESYPQKGVEWLKKGAQFGDVEAMVGLARAYAIGNGIIKDTKQAFNYFEQAANLGSASAMRELGYLYIYGTGVKMSENKGIEWFKKAANRGDSKAMLELSNAYAAGFGVEESSERSKFWLEKAVSSGNEIAKEQFILNQTVGYGLPQI